MSNDPENKNYLEYIGLGSEIAAGLSIPVIFGYWLDDQFQTFPWLLLTGIVVGILIMLAIFIRIIKDTKSQD